MLTKELTHKTEKYDELWTQFQKTETYSKVIERELQKLKKKFTKLKSKRFTKDIDEKLSCKFCGLDF